MKNKDFEDAIDRFSDELELLSYLSAEEEGIELLQEVPQRENQKELPLSFAQERLWFMNQLDPDSSAYNICLAVRFTGSLDVILLEKIFNIVIQRHETLRTVFDMTNERPTQVILPELVLQLPVVNLQRLPEDKQEAEVMRRAVEKTEHPFDLTQGPLLRPVLFQLGQETHVLILAMHHIISDGWSTGVLIREMATLYEAFLTKKAFPLPTLPVQYADYAIWQRQWLQGEVLKKQLTYWKQQLEGAPMLELPTDRPRPAIRTLQGAHQTLNLSLQLTNGLKALSTQEGTTLFMTLLAAFNTLLYRYTGQDDIVIGSPIANRNRVEIEGLIGFFVNNLVLRTNLTGNPSFRELLGRIKKTTLEAHAHQDLPFEKLVEELNLERNLSHSPLFQVVFSLQNTPRPTVNLTNLTLTPLEIERTTAKFDLDLFMIETEQGLIGSLEYSTELFDDDTITRLLGHFQTLLEGIVSTNANQRLSDLPLLTEIEHHQLLTEWNDSQTNYSVDLCLHQMFERQVERTPNAVALTFEKKSITYLELNQQANQLAHYLQKSGVGPDVLVGICMERCLEMVVGILGVLKAGGAYLPLDPAYPKERLVFMLMDAEVPVVLTQENQLNVLPKSEMQLVCLDSDWEMIAKEVTTNPTCETVVDSLAYIIYTSGSTGKPKGTMISHANVIRLFKATHSWYHFDEQDVWTLFHSHAFDFSVWEIWGALLYGGRLVVVPYLVSRSPKEFHELLSQEGVTVLNQTPSAFRQLIRVKEEVMDDAKDLKLRLVVFGGEALELGSLKPWYDSHEDTCPQLINMYGITETTIHATYRPLAKTDIDAARSSLIGCAIPDLQIYILDQYLHPVPIGVPGEIHVGGPGLAQGYLNRPGLTANRFIPNPFSKKPGARLYKTGDLACWLPSGDIDFLGRIDYQVKIRGFRIELGEIETVLAEHEAIQEVIVLDRYRNGEDGDKQLVAYIVNKLGQSSSINDLRIYLKTKLPEYMIPSAFVFLEAMPLTPNGKIDQRALPAPGNIRPDLPQSYVPPRNLTEEALATIWASVLKLNQVGVHDNFFAIGGDSIISLQIIAQARKQELVFSLPQLFQHQTIAELSPVITQQSTPELEIRTSFFDLVSESNQIRLPEYIEDAYPLAMLQAGMIYHMELAQETNVYHNVASYHLSNKTIFNAELFKQAVAYTVARHPVLRTGFDMDSYSQPLQLVYKQATLAVECHDISHLSHEEQEGAIASLVESERFARFDFKKPTLLRFFIHLRSNNSFQFTLTECHAILDGWSLYSILVEIFSRYSNSLKDIPLVDEPPYSVTYRDFVALEQQAINSPECEQFWAEHLADYTFLHLPRLTARTPPTFDVRTVRKTLSQSTYAGLQQLVQTISLPLKNILMAVHLKAMSIVSGQQDTLTGLATNGRLEGEDGANLTGLFLNTVPFRFKLVPGTWQELMQAVFQQERAMIPYRRYPAATMQKKWGGQEGLYEVMFNFIHFHIASGLIGSSSDLEVLSGLKSEATNNTLTVHFQIHPSNNNLTLTFDYDASQLKHQQVEQMAGYYQAIIAQIIANPQALHHHYSPLSATERQQLSLDWNNTETDYPKEQCIHHLFEEQVERTPDAIAVVAPSLSRPVGPVVNEVGGVFKEQVSLTYQELNQRANQLAHYLISQGVGPEVLVGICVKRSLDMIIGILAILKAGGAYLPLDPDYPQERLSFMLQDTDALVLLITTDLLDKLPGCKQVILFDTLRSHTSQMPAHNLPVQTTAHNLAYVMYTSGSTGKPKGVSVVHKNVVRLVKDTNYATFGKENVFLQLAPISFDAATLEIWGPLLNGAQLVIFPPERPTLETIGQIIRNYQVNFLWLTAGLFHLMVEERLEDLRGVRQLLAGGDVLSGWHIEKVLQELPECQLINGYGPTENTTFTSYCVFRNETQISETIPIGKAIANTTIYILDANLLLAPVGVPGELYIGGDGLSRGYVNRPELTAESFIPNPFMNKDEVGGTRLYKTGDLARNLPSGNIELLGRIDHQVKVRGFRVELGEIESVLNQHSQVRESVVVARQDKARQKQLVAYLIPEGEEPPDPDDLRHFGSQNLPDYMLPSAFVTLEAFPLTPNGKIDRLALPVPDADNIQRVPPRTLLEKQLAVIWQDVLGLEQVGVHDNFFAVGGHSLLALQLIVLIGKGLHKKLPLELILQCPTIAQLSEFINLIGKDSAPILDNDFLDWQAEAVLEPTICPPSVSPSLSLTSSQAIFLTGATGFLGVYLLYELLLQTSASIYCLVRAENLDKGWARLQSGLKAHSLWDETFEKRIVPVVGDLGQPLLGISEEQFKHLATKIDSVYHNGAWISGMASYSDIKAPNVIGTQEVLRLACHTKAKPVHYISTIGVYFSTVDLQGEVLFEVNPLEITFPPRNAYAQSKWIAEKLVMEAYNRGLPVSIYRPSRITGHSQTGMFNTSDLFFLFLKGCIQQGMIPDEFITWDNWVTVDYVSKAIIHLSSQTKMTGQAFNVVNPHNLSMEKLFKKAIELGYTFEEMPIEKWLTDANIQFDFQNVLDGLADSNIECPLIDDQLLNTYFSHFINNSHLPKPSKLQVDDEKMN